MMTNRQMVASAEQTLDVAREHAMDVRLCFPFDDPDESVMYPHLEEMVAKMRENVDTWSPAKMGRWLGWIQASVVAVCSPGTDTKWLDVMKAINVGNT